MAAARAWTDQTLGPAESNCLWLIAEWESQYPTRRDPYVWNGRGSGAWGLWQIKPVTKLQEWAAARGLVWWTPLAQAMWAAEYARTRYGSACGAMQARSAKGWW